MGWRELHPLGLAGTPGAWTATLARHSAQPADTARHRGTFKDGFERLYSSLWQSCDEIRAGGGLEASQYEGYVLVVLFLNYPFVQSLAPCRSLPELARSIWDGLVTS